MPTDIHGYFIEDLELGQSASFTKTITDADVTLFAGISGDLNPIHINNEFAQASRFKERIVHGSLTASLVSTVLGTKLPGPGAIFVSQETHFRAPVKIGDTVTASVKLIELNREKKRAIFQTECTVGPTIVLDGKATVFVESRG